MSCTTHPSRAKALLTCVAIAGTLLLTTAVTSAGQPAIHLTESGSALKYADLKVLVQPDVLTISADDVSRGYVDVPFVTRISVRSNADSFLLMLEGNATYARQIRIAGLEDEVQMSGRGGVVKQLESTNAGSIDRALDLTFRFDLAPSAVAGVHAWPIRLAASPL